MPKKSYLPKVKPGRRSRSNVLTSWNKVKPGSIFGFVSNLKSVGIQKCGGRVFIDIDAKKVGLMTPEDWAEVQAQTEGLIDNE